MTPEQALHLLDAARRRVAATYDDHVALQQAVDTLRTALAPRPAAEPPLPPPPPAG